MSVTLTYYVVYGIMLNEKAYNKISDLIEEYNDSDDLHLCELYDSFTDDYPVQDYMSGQYSFLGEVLYRFSPWEDYETFKEIDISNLDKLKETTLKRAEKYPFLKEFFDNREFKLYTVAVYR